MGDRRGDGYWFPLVLLGFGLLTLLGWETVTALDDRDWFAYGPTGYEVTQTMVAVSVADSPLGFPSRDWPWAVLIVVTLVGTVAWYAFRARRAGGSVRTHVALAVAAGLAVPACYIVAGLAGAIADPAGMVLSVGLPLLVLAALAGTAARSGFWRRTAAAVAIVCAVTGFATVLGAWSPGLLESALITVSLLALAWYERSRLLAVTAVAVPVALVALPDGVLAMLVPAAIALAVAIAALVRQNSPA
jgi:hypothetical protein